MTSPQANHAWPTWLSSTVRFLIFIKAFDKVSHSIQAHYWHIVCTTMWKTSWSTRLKMVVIAVWSPASGEVLVAFMRASVSLLLTWTMGRKALIKSLQTLANCRNRLYTGGHDCQRDLSWLRNRLTGISLSSEANAKSITQAGITP